MSLQCSDPFITVLSYCDAFGIHWQQGAIWLAPGSPVNARPRAPMRLLDAYEEAIPLPPTPEDLALVLSELAVRIPPNDAQEFELHAAVLRATAQDYYA